MLSRRFAGTARVAALTAGLLAGGAALAQPDYRDLGYLQLDRIIGMRVVDENGAALGVIRDLVLDSATRKVESIAVAPTGTPGRLDRYPVEALIAGQPGEVVVRAPASASAGASALMPGLRGRNTTFASIQGPASALAVNLADGTLGPAPRE